jgi:FtsH-binding integral membrane protein
VIATVVPRPIHRAREVTGRRPWDQGPDPGVTGRATGAFVASLGAVGYATRRDLSSWYRVLFWALLGLLVFELVAIFVSIPGANVIWSVAGLVIFGGYTVLDFNRLRRAGEESAVPIAASIFLDVLHLPVPAPAVRQP